jgi:3-oxoacyl-[acyl-carrier-protein] synthase II
MEQFLAAPILRDALRGLPIHGPALTTCSACSSGLGAIALGMTLLRTGQADLVLAGGYDPVSEYVYAGFDSLRLVAESDARPFSKNRDGMKIAEGYAIVALEREADAQSAIRNPQSAILARVLGYGETSDSHHLTQPHPEGEGAARAIRAALTSSNLPPQAIGLISAHATSTPNNDAAEFAAISQVFGDRTKDLPVVAFKSHIGHTLGGAGAAELILSLLALREQTFPPTANTTQDTLDFPIRLNFGEPRPTDIAATLNLSLGFGGSNAAMVLTRGTGLPPGAGSSPATFSATDPPGRSPVPRPVLLTGIGFVAPNLIGNEPLRQLSSHPTSPSHLDDAHIAHLLNARRVRRMSEYVKATLAATTVAFQDAGIQDIPAWTNSAAAILGTCLGSSNFCETYYRPITTDGLSAANPALFAEGVPNAAAAQLSLMFQVKGGCQTIIGSRTAGIDALWLASLRIASGEWDRAIVSAGEELHETATAIYKSLGLEIPLSTGAVSIVLESEPSARARNIEPRAIIDPSRAGAIRADGPASLARAALSLVSRLDDASLLITPGNGTWIDRIHTAAARALPGTTRSTHRLIPDLASANALAGLAVALLAGDQPKGPISILAADYAGTASALQVTPGPRLGRP